MKPHIKPLGKTGDGTPYWVSYRGHGKRVVISGCQCAVAGKSPIALLADEIANMVARMGPPVSLDTGERVTL